jgi:hypothetical protein
MSCCLNREELTRVILCLLKDAALEEAEIQAWAEGDACEEEVVGLAYLLVQVLTRMKRQGQTVDRAISEFFDLPNRMWFAVEEFGSDFVEYMLRNSRDRSMSLEDDIVEIVTKMRRHQYGHTLRL